MAIEVALGSEIVTLATDQTPHIEDASNSPDLKWLAEILQERSAFESDKLIEFVKKRDFHGVTESTGYLTALNDVIQLIRTGLHEAIHPSDTK